MDIPVLRQSILNYLTKGSASAASIQNYLHHELNLNTMDVENKYEISRQIQKMTDEGLIRFGRGFYLELVN